MQVATRRALASVNCVAYVIVILAPIAAGSGCAPTALVSSSVKVQNLSPDQFYEDKKQVMLAEAVDQGNSEAVRAAVKAGADVGLRGRDGYSLLYWAMARGRVAGFEALIECGADLTQMCRDPSVGRAGDGSWDIIRSMVAPKNASFLKAALRHGFNPNHICTSSGKETPIFLAVDHHSYSAMQLLADWDADLNWEDSSGYSPLAYAMTLRDYRAAFLLLENGADPLTGKKEEKDIVAMLKTYGSRGVRPDQEPYFEKVVAELVRRGLLTRQDIVEADKPKPPALGGRTGVTVIEHPAGSEAGQTIRQLDDRERATVRQDQQ